MRLLLLLVASVAFAQDWQNATELPALDLTGFTPAQKTTLLKLLRTEACSCPCNMRVAECRVKDPGCGDSRTLASIAAQEIKAGKKAEQVLATLRTSDLAKARRAALLGEPVAIKTAGAPSKGPANARVTIVEFSDFQCPYCRVAAMQVYKVLEMFPNDVKLVFKQFPLETHSQAELAAQASLAANAQGKFWQLHDKMFTNPKQISKDQIMLWAKEVGMDVVRLAGDLQANRYKKQVEAEVLEGVAAGVSGTPTFFINNKAYRAMMDPEILKPLIEEELKKASK